MLKHENYLNWKGWDPNLFGSFTPKESQRFRLELKSLKLKRAARILEIGFGHGHFMAWAKSQDYRVEGIEKNPHLVEIAIQKAFSQLRPTEKDTAMSNTISLPHGMS